MALRSAVITKSDTGISASIYSQCQKKCMSKMSDAFIKMISPDVNVHLNVIEKLIIDFACFSEIVFVH